MAVNLNAKGKSHAASLVAQGKVNKTTSWSMSASDEDAILGDPPKWGGYGQWFLGVDDAEKEETKAHYKYPFGKGGKVYRSALTAIRQRAGQQNATAIFDAAGALLDKIDKKPTAKSASEMSYRSAPLSVRADGPSTLDAATRSVEVVLTTENPARVYDFDRGIINEILLMSGAQIPESRQLVMLDAHSRFETANIIGSAREIRIEGDQMVGRAQFSTAPEAESPWIKTKEGHLTDFSIGYRNDEVVWVGEEQVTTIEGRNFAGPVQVVTKWTPRELSAVPVGADAAAKARSDINPQKEISNKEEIKTMDPKLRKFLERCGLPVTATEEEALAFAERADPPKPAAAPAATVSPDTTNAPDLDKIRADATGKERDRIREIDALLQKYDCQDLARDLIVGKDGKVPTLEDAQRVVLDKLQAKAKETTPAFSGIRIGADEKDKFRAAANDALILRAGMEVKAPAQGAQDLRGLTLVEMARECLRVAGIIRHGATKEMVGRALTSSDFPYILANLATKAMQLAWAAVSETWNIWCGIGSVSDFKTYYDNALSEHDDLEEVPDSGEIKIGSFTEKLPETYKAVTYAKKFAITRVMIINDDLGALTEMPARRAEAAGRKIADVAYAVITANGNMGDSHPIFSTTYHANDAISGFMSAPGITNLAEGIRAMGVQKDLKGLRRLNISPVFFIAPKALQGVAEVFFKSDRFSDHSTVATDSSFASTRSNPYSGDYFTRVYESRLDDDSVYAWYLMGPKGRTVKVVFLNGVQAPLMEMRQPGFTIEGMEYVVSVDAGAYATDYRAMYRNEGA